jgi:hypothetical protein
MGRRVLLFVSLLEIAEGLIRVWLALRELTPPAKVVAMADASIFLALGLGGLLVLRLPAAWMPVSIIHALVLALSMLWLIAGVGRFFSAQDGNAERLIRILAFEGKSVVVCTLSIVSARKVGRIAGY